MPRKKNYFLKLKRLISQDTFYRDFGRALFEKGLTDEQKVAMVAAYNSAWKAMQTDETVLFYDAFATRIGEVLKGDKA
ncbi:hypothetical protein [Caballeronia grimmiae]|uniref:hypothetical protein n=1 Tax=Caballeronia grimmiae TaxID=1071679 RepID=UPI0038BC025C